MQISSKMWHFPRKQATDLLLLILFTVVLIFIFVKVFFSLSILVLHCQCMCGHFLASGMFHQCMFLWLTPGHNCEFLPCEASNPCENGAVCVEESDQERFPLGFRCRCRRGFTGPRCEINVDECSSNPCFNGFCYDGKKPPISPTCPIPVGR